MPQYPEDFIHQWHTRFGHRNPKIIRCLTNNNLATDMNVNDCPIKQVCECCIKGKISRKAFPKESKSHAKQPFDLIHSDLCGPMPIHTPEERRYLMTLIDDYS